MNRGATVFAQIMDFLPLKKFRQCVDRYQGNHHIFSFSCLDQFLCMTFAQLTYRDSLRNIECCLRALQPKLYQVGIRGKVSRSTLADANEKRDWRIYADFAQLLILEARAHITPMKTLACSSKKAFMGRMPRSSICVCRYSPGRAFGKPRPASSCIRFPI